MKIVDEGRDTIETLVMSHFADCDDAITINVTGMRNALEECRLIPGYIDDAKIEKGIRDVWGDTWRVTLRS